MKFLKPPQREDDPVLLTTFSSPLPAHSLRILLEACGVQAVVTGEETNATFGGPVMSDLGLASVQIFVRRNDYEDARKIMLEVPAAAEILVSSWNCQCGAEVDEGFSVCWSCGIELEFHWDDP